MYLLGQKTLIWVPHQQDLCASTWDQAHHNNRTCCRRGCQTPKATVAQRLGYSAEARLAEGTWTSLTQNQHCPPQLAKLVQGEERAGHLPQLCLVKGSTPQATEKTHGVWIPTRLTGKSGALLLSLVKLKRRWKHLAEGCGCFQMERQLKAGFEGPGFGLRHLFLHGATLTDWWERSTGEDVVPIFNLLWLYKY